MLGRQKHVLSQSTTPSRAPYTKIYSKVLRYKWEAYCNTNGRLIAIQMRGVLTVFTFPQSAGAREALQCQLIGGVLQYKLEVCCDTFLRSSAGWGF